MRQPNVFTIICTALLLLLPPASSLALRKKRNNCTGNSDPDCLPYYNYYKRNATFDDLTPKTAIQTYKGVNYTGFEAIQAPTGQPQPPSPSPHILPASGSFYIRAANSATTPARITSAGDIFKFKSLAFACSEYSSATPIPCTLNISGFDPGKPVPVYRNSVVLAYSGDPGPNGQAAMATATEAGDLAGLQIANYYTLSTVGPQGFRPRLYLDDVDVVYYKSIL